jgi:ATP synthase, F0 subunit b
MHPVSDEGRMRRYGGASTPKPAIELTMNINFTLLAQALAFAGLIWIIATKIWPPLMNAIEERQQKIAEGLAAADRSQKDLAQAQEKVNEALKEARTKANEIIDQAHARANQIVDAARNEAITEATRQKELAQAEIDAAANRAREDLRKQVSALAVTGAEKLLKREIDADAHKALLDELASEI